MNDPSKLSTLETRMESLLTQWDIKQSKKKSYNIYGLGIMLNRSDLMCKYLWEHKGSKLEDALKMHFNDRLLTFLLKEFGCWK